MTADEGYAWDRLRFQLEVQVGFWFGLVAGDDTRPREQLRGSAKVWCQENGQTFQLHTVEPNVLAALAIELAQGAHPGLHWIRADGPLGLIDEWEPAAAQLLLAMNERREAYRQRLDGGVVLEGRASLKRLLRERAPDLFSIRSFLIEPGVGPSMPEVDRPEWRAPVLSLTELGSGSDPDRELARAAQLEGDHGIGARKARLKALQIAAEGLGLRRRVIEAKRVAQQSMSLVQELSHELPDDATVERRLRQAYRLEGFTDSLQGKHRTALEYFEIALQRAKRFTQQHPESEWDLIEVAELHGSRAYELAALGELTGAIDAANTRVACLDSLAAAGFRPVLTNHYLATAKQRLAALLLSNGNLDDGERIARDALTLAESQVANAPTDPEATVNLIEGYLGLASFLQKRGDLTASADFRRKALAITEELARGESPCSRWTSMLSNQLTTLGMDLIGLGEMAGALAARQRALVITERAAALAPNDASWGWMVVNNLSYLAVTLVLMRQRKEALAIARRACASARALPVRWPGDISTGMVVASTLRVVIVLTTSGRRKRSTEHAILGFREVIELVRRFVAMEPDNSDFQHHIAETYRLLADVLRKSDNIAEAEEAIACALAMDGQATILEQTGMAQARIR